MKELTPRVKGLIFALCAAICYGFIPTFTLPIHASNPDALQPNEMPDASILFYRFFFAAVMMGIIMLIKRKSFRVNRPEFAALAYLAFLSDGAAIFLLGSYSYMSTGIATTIHFTYPCFTALFMMLFYHEARRKATLLAVVLAVLGVGVLSWQPGEKIELEGIIIALISAVCYALYIVRVNRSAVAEMDPIRLTFYILLLGSIFFAGEALRTDRLVALSSPTQVSHLLLLAFICTVLSNVSLVIAVKSIGSTMTSVLGALEPVTAVLLGSLLFHEPFNLHVGLGLTLIIPAVVIIIVTQREAKVEYEDPMSQVGESTDSKLS